jgi:GT2 family glycosyltransferase
VSIIILNFNGKRFLTECLNSVINSTYSNYEILFVDNCSTDGSTAFINQNYPSVKIIANKENLGFAIANNNASYIARGKYIVFLNCDIRILPETISKLVEGMERDPTVGICACKIMSYDGKSYFHTGIGIDIYGYPMARGGVFYSEGSCLMIRETLFHEIGGFDVKYFMFHEDIDLAWRVWLIGYKVVPIPEALVCHWYGGIAGGGIEKGKYTSTLFRRYLSERNNIRTILKNYSLKTLLTILPRYMMINFGEISLFSVSLQFKVTLCYLKAYWWNIINLRDTLESRGQINQRRRVSDKEIMKKMYKGSGKLLNFRKVGFPRFE